MFLQCMWVCARQRERAKMLRQCPRQHIIRYSKGTFPLSALRSIVSLMYVKYLNDFHTSSKIDINHDSFQFLSIKKVQTKLENVVWYYQLKYWVRPKNASLHYPMSLYFDNVICLAYIQQSFSNWEKKNSTYDKYILVQTKLWQNFIYWEREDY